MAERKIKPQEEQEIAEAVKLENAAKLVRVELAGALNSSAGALSGNESGSLAIYLGLDPFPMGGLGVLRKAFEQVAAELEKGPQGLIEEVLSAKARPSKREATG